MPDYTTGTLEGVLHVFERDVAAHMERLVTTLHSELCDATPVNTGEALSAWTASAAPTSARPKHSTSGNTHGTNDMPLGSEPRRPANEAIAKQSVAAMDFSKPLAVAYIQNHAPTIVALEYGELPSEEKSRTPPGGIIDTAIQRTLRKV